jgi:hypothetical protein
MAEPNGIEARLEREWRELLSLASGAVSASPLDLPPERRKALSRVSLLAQLEEVREDFRALRGLVDADVGGRFINAGWTVKDLLAHAASWAREFRVEVETVLRNERFDYVIPFAMSVIGPNEWNEREVQARRPRSVAEIFEEFDEETAKLQELVLAMSDEDVFRGAEFPLSPSGDPSQLLQGPLGFIVAGKCFHDRHHIAQIRERLTRFRG